MSKYSTTPAKLEEDEDDKAMKDFLDRLKQDRLAGQHSSQSSASGIHQDPLFNTLLEFALPKTASDSADDGAVTSGSADNRPAMPFTADIADLKRPNSFLVNEIGNRVVACSTNHELKSALQEFVHTFFPPSGDNVDSPSHVTASPKLLAAIIAKSRKLRNEHLAYALLQYIKDRGMVSLVSWFNVHVYNELIYMEWEMTHSLQNISLHVKEMTTSGIVANTYTKFLLEKIKEDLQKRASEGDAGFWNGSVIEVFRKDQSCVTDDEWGMLMLS